MKNLKKLVALGAVVAASSSMAFADSITLSGGDTFDNSGINFIGTQVVSAAQDGAGKGSPNGLYASFFLQTAMLTSFQYANAAGVTVFTVTNPAGQTLSFTIDKLSTESITSNSNGAVLNLAGLGTFSETGMSDLMGTFSLTSSAAGSGSTDLSYQLIGSPTSVTPEPNSLVLLGTGLIGAAGMLFMRRRNATAGIF